MYGRIDITLAQPLITTLDLASLSRVRVRVAWDDGHKMAQPLVSTAELTSLSRVRVVWDDGHQRAQLLVTTTDLASLFRVRVGVARDNKHHMGSFIHLSKIRFVSLGLGLDETTF